MSLDPAKSIIAKLGGIDATASATGVHKSRVYRWMAPKGAVGTGGRIPQRHIPGLLRRAADIGDELTYADFFEVAPDDCRSDPDASPASAATALPDDARSPETPADQTLRPASLVNQAGTGEAA